MALERLFNSLPVEWQYTTLGEACGRGGGNIQTGPFGSQLHAADYVAEGIPTIMPQNLGDNRVIEEGIARISLSDANRLARHRVMKGDIVYSRRGDVERRALIRDREIGWLCGTGSLRVRFGQGVVDPVYASYYLGHPSVREWVVRHAHGATMPNLNTSILSALPFVIPPLAEQRAIAHILGSLDDKIDLNRRMNRTLEEIARALFRSWFVDFDPVHAHARGEAMPGLDPALDALFPAAFEDSPLGPIPAGWRVGVVDELGEVVCGKTPPTSDETNYGNDVPFVRIPDMHGRVYATTTEKALSRKGAGSQSNKYLPADSVCVSCIATPGLVVLTSAVSQTNQQINSVIPKETVSPYWCFFVLRAMGSTIEAGGSGGSVFFNLSTGRFRNLRVLIPADSIMRQYHETVSPLFAGILTNERESRTLAALRDTLLPKLMSGELRVAAAAEIAEAAA